MNRHRHTYMGGYYYYFYGWYCAGPSTACLFE